MFYLFAGVFRGFPLSQSAPASGADWDCGCHNPMLAITVDNSFIFAVLPECRSCPRFSAALFCSYHRKIISHSDGHSVVNRQNKKPIHRDIKNRREHCSRFKMMKLCIGSVNSETIYLLINHSASRFAFMSGAALSAAAGSSYFGVSFCIQLLFFIINHGTYVCQYF